MNTIIHFSLVAFATLLTACGGGDDGKASELEPCRSMLISKGVSAAQLQNPASIASRSVQADNSVILDFSNGINLGTTGYKSYGSCLFVAGKIVSVTLADGTVIAVP